VGLPPAAAWRHVDARDGFEVLFARHEESGYRFEGHVAALENGDAWSVSYTTELDASWATRSAHVVGRSVAGEKELRLVADGTGGWQVDGERVAHLTGCLDVDLEASVLTNAFPVHRLALEVGHGADAPAAYVRAPGLAIERLEQRYERLPDDDGRGRYDYSAPTFDYAAELVYDEFGLVLDYPGIAFRLA
jgi:uncharacterized protein